MSEEPSSWSAYVPIITGQEEGSSLRHMEEVVTHAVAAHAEEIAEVAQAAVRQAVRDFDWKTRIVTEVEAAVDLKVRDGISQFLWSADGVGLLHEAIATAIVAAFGRGKMEAAE